LALKPNSDLARLVLRLLDKTKLDTLTLGLLWTTDKVFAEAATYTTHNKYKETNIHALSGIQTRDPNNRAAADLRLATWIGTTVIYPVFYKASDVGRN
jgi:hypothetical protein